MLGTHCAKLFAGPESVVPVVIYSLPVPSQCVSSAVSLIWRRQQSILSLLHLSPFHDKHLDGYYKTVTANCHTIAAAASLSCRFFTVPITAPLVACVFAVLAIYFLKNQRVNSGTFLERHVFCFLATSESPQWLQQWLLRLFLNWRPSSVCGNVDIRSNGASDRYKKH